MEEGPSWGPPPLLGGGGVWLGSTQLILQGAHGGGKVGSLCLSLPAGDFLLLLCASQQWQVFAAERTEEWLMAAGENTDLLELARGRPNPVPNFINCR